jgi:putative transposon-encoded protein
MADSHIMARKVRFETKTRLTVEGILGFMKRRVTPYGTGAKVTCPKEFMGKTAYLVITGEEWKEEEERKDD